MASCVVTEYTKLGSLTLVVANLFLFRFVNYYESRETGFRVILCVMDECVIIYRLDQLVKELYLRTAASTDD